MIAVYRKDTSEGWTPEKAYNAAKTICLNNHAENKFKEQLSKFVFDVPPSERDEHWALQVQAFIEANFKAVPSQKTSLEAESK